MKNKKENMKPGKDHIGVGCGALILDKMGTKTLLLKRSNNSKMGKGEWNRPGGKVEFGEKLEDAIKREVLEEVGVKIKILKFLGYTDHFTDGQHWISYGFLAKIEEGDPINMEPDKHDEIGWFDFEDLPESLALPTKEGIETFLYDNYLSY